MSAREQFAAHMHAARVFRGMADGKPAARVFWLKSALAYYAMARVVRNRIVGAV